MSDEAMAWAEACDLRDPVVRAVLLAIAEAHQGGLVTVSLADLARGEALSSVHVYMALRALMERGLLYASSIGPMTEVSLSINMDAGASAGPAGQAGEAAE